MHRARQAGLLDRVTVPRPPQTRRRNGPPANFAPIYWHGFFGETMDGYENERNAQIWPMRRKEDEMVDPINVVVDISHWNRDVDFAKLANAGIIGVIQKATQGQTGVDFTYNTNKPKALAAGLLWGAYHFGDGSDGVAQAEHFLSTVGDPSKTLLVLDFEFNRTGPSMSL